MAVCYCNECKNVFVTRNENENVAVCPKCGKNADILSQEALKIKKDDIYLCALHKKQIALYPRDLEEAKEIFLSLGSYRDCESQIESCEYLIKRFNERERAEIESRTLAPKKIKKILRISLSAVLVLALFISSVSLLVSPVKYAIAKSNYEKGNYDKAAEIFEDISDFGESRDYLKKIYERFSEKEGKLVSCSALEPYFEVNAAGAIKFIRGNYSGNGKIVIPSVFDGIEVDSVATNAFKNYSKLVSVELPESVTSINAYAFYGCKNLESIAVPDTVKSISHYAFKDCSSLKSVNIPEGVTAINANTFSGCSSLEFPALPSTLTKIDTSAFMGCASFEKAVLPMKVSEIGSFAFSGCASLTEITFSLNTTVIKENAFYSCTALNKVIYMGTAENFEKLEVEKRDDDLKNVSVEYAVK